MTYSSNFKAMGAIALILKGETDQRMANFILNEAKARMLGCGKGMLGLWHALHAAIATAVVARAVTTAVTDNLSTISGEIKRCQLSKCKPMLDLQKDIMHEALSCPAWLVCCSATSWHA